jgi:hypothetical protein
VRVAIAGQGRHDDAWCTWISIGRGSSHAFFLARGHAL